MGKKKIEFSPPDISDLEIEEVVDTLKSGWITTGPKTKLFERQIAEYCNCNKCACLNSATACLELALRIFGVGEGDEVITSAYTYTASASIICHLGAKVVLVDTEKDSYEMDREQLERVVSERTKAIIAVDIAGVVCDYDSIYEIVQRKTSLFHAKNEMQKQLGRILVVSDSAHGFGAERDGKKSGEFADFTCFSFHAVKNLTTGEGGAVVWNAKNGFNDEEIYKQFMLLSLHGQSKDALAKAQLGAWEYDVEAPYYKCNMTDIMASLGIAQLKRYPELLTKRSDIINRYDEKLKDLPVDILQHYGENFKSSGHLYIVRVRGKSREQCNEIITKMAAAGIATNVHYKPLPLLSAYRNRGFAIEDFPNAYQLFKNAITLPLHTKLSDDEVDYVTDTLEQCIKQV